MKERRNKDTSNRFLALIRSDFKQGIIKKWYYFIIIVPIVIYLLALFESELLGMQMLGVKLHKRTMMDYIMYVFKGVREHRLGEDYEALIMFLTFNFIPALIVSYYPSDNLTERGKVLLTRTRSRAMWWYNKCIWNIMCIVLFYIAIYLTIFAYTCANGTISLLPSAEVLENMYGIINTYTTYQYIAYMIILPIVTTISISLMQMAIALIFSPIYGMVVQVLLLSVSSFYISPYLPGNFLMLLRNHLYREDGIQFGMSISICIIIFVISIILGRVDIEQKDIM